MVQNVAYRNEVVAKLFENAKAATETEYEIPVFEDLHGRTALDEALGVVETRSRDGLLVPKTKKNRGESCNVGMATILLQKIKDYKYLHSGPNLVEAITQAIKKDVPNVGEFLDSRFVKSKNSISQNQKSLV